MQSQLSELRTRLAEVSLDDLTAVHELYLDVKKLSRHVSRTSRHYLDMQETARRADRALGLAIRAAQERGELNTREGCNIPGAMSTRVFFPSKGMSTAVYAVTDNVTDEEFEKALVAARARGNLSQTVLMQELGTVTGRARERVPSKRSTGRGRRTINHMAIQMNAMAMGVADLDPSEVSPEEMESLIFQVFEDIGTIRSFLKKVNQQNANQ